MDGRSTYTRIQDVPPYNILPGGEGSLVEVTGVKASLLSLPGSCDSGPFPPWIRINTIAAISLMISSPSGKLTTVTLPERVRDRLRDYQVGGKSAAGAIESLMDEVPRDNFRRDLQQALLLPRESLDEFRRVHGLTSKR